jgi:hypothetical protein
MTMFWNSGRRADRSVCSEASILDLSQPKKMLIFNHAVDRFRHANACEASHMCERNIIHQCSITIIVVIIASSSSSSITMTSKKKSFLVSSKMQKEIQSVASGLPLDKLLEAPKMSVSQQDTFIFNTCHGKALFFFGTSAVLLSAFSDS